MSDRALRTALIKLASAHPEFRKEILPLLKGAAKDVPDQHQLKILKDTVTNPLKGKFLGGPTAEEAEKILKEKFDFTDKQIAKLKSAAASNGGYDEMNVGKVKPGGSAKGDKGSDAAKPWLKGEFTQQEFHELGEKQESGQLNDGKFDDVPAKVAKIKAVVKMAKTARAAGEQAYKVACSCGEAPVAAVEVAKKAVQLWKKQNPSA